jgi:hypothetical protein
VAEVAHAPQTCTKEQGLRQAVSDHAWSTAPSHCRAATETHTCLRRKCGHARRGAGDTKELCIRCGSDIKRHRVHSSGSAGGGGVLRMRKTQAAAQQTERQADMCIMVLPTPHRCVNTATCTAAHRHTHPTTHKRACRV